MILKFSGRRVLVTGGGCDLGLALAETLIAAGLEPLLTYRDTRGLDRIRDRLAEYDGHYQTIDLDLKAPEKSAGMAGHLNRGVDYLVDMAQGDLEGLVPSVDGRAIGDFFDADIRGRAFMIQQVARAMLACRKGRMVYISSAAAGRPNPGQGFYAAAKQASEALYRNIGLELAGRGITSVILRPGYLDTGRGRRYIGQRTPEALAKVPLGRALTVPEVVDTIMFLLCDSAVGFNATVVTMDGGLSAGK